MSKGNIMKKRKRIDARDEVKKPKQLPDDYVNANPVDVEVFHEGVLSIDARILQKVISNVGGRKSNRVVEYTNRIIRFDKNTSINENASSSAVGSASIASTPSAGKIRRRDSLFADQTLEGVVGSPSPQITSPSIATPAVAPDTAPVAPPPTTVTPTKPVAPVAPSTADNPAPIQEDDVMDESRAYVYYDNKINKLFTNDELEDLLTDITDDDRLTIQEIDRLQKDIDDRQDDITDGKDITEDDIMEHGTSKEFQYYSHQINKMFTEEELEDLLSNITDDKKLTFDEIAELQADIDRRIKYHLN